MKSYFILALACLASASAVGQSALTIETDAFDVAVEIRRTARYLTPSERLQIASDLQSIRSVLSGEMSGAPNLQQYTCASRDNDGRAPFVVAFRQGIQLDRIPGETYSSDSACRAALSSIRSLGRTGLLCVSRDADGRSPYQLASLVGAKISRLDRTQVSTQQECATLLNELRPRRGQVTFCSSRDRDGRSPYVAVSLNVNDGSVQVGTEVFDKLTGCQQFIGN